MTCLDVESLFTNIPLEETISLCYDSLFSSGTKVDNINRIDFERLFRAALQNKILANAFCNSMNRFGLMNVLMNSNLHTTEVMLMIYLFLFEKFKNYLNSKHTNIRLTCEKEQNNSMPFLDGLITRT